MKGPTSSLCKVYVKFVRLFFSFGIFYLEFLAYYGESASKTAIVGSVLNGMYLSMGEDSLHPIAYFDNGNKSDQKSSMPYRGIPAGGTSGLWEESHG